MQHLNYCRQAIKQWRAYLDVPSTKPDDPLGAYLSLAEVAKKFLMPDGGGVIEDDELRGLDWDSPLKLPFPVVALEFRFGGNVGLRFHDTGSFFDKYIVFASQSDDDGFIRVWSAGHQVHDGLWVIATPAQKINIQGCLTSVQGRPHIVITEGQDSVDGRTQHDIGIVVELLNALACTNVNVERSPARRKGKALKNAFPFDDYHILTIGAPAKQHGDGTAHCSHRSPREHLRRGHIRRYESGMKVWVNATVVNAGIGGKITKDYKVGRARNEPIALAG
ncbi:MAG: hypothetical protein WC023_06255 [Rhodocyclaceae bacterium]